MRKSLSKALDNCLKRIANGETVADCLADYPYLSEELVPLLDTAALVNSSPKISASGEFRKASYSRLMAQLSPEHVSTTERSYSSSPWVADSDNSTSVWETLVNAITGARRVALAAMLVCILILTGSLFLYGPFRFFSSDTALAAPCTLTILSGTVVSQSTGSDIWVETADGIILEAGSRIKTDSDSHATLTFFDGSTIKLEPNTDMTIQKVEQTNKGAPVIVLNQWLGKTWSRVIEMTIPGSQYEIHTPSAAALVRGTMFTTEVIESGLTKVKTTEGIVSVVAQDYAVDVTAGLETSIQAGVTPSEPLIVPPPESKLIFSFDMPAIGSVCDPTGASTGYLPNGLAFNQIPDSQASIPGDGTQIITIPHPIAGDYMVILRAIDDGTVGFSIRGESDDQTVLEQIESQHMAEGAMLVIHLNVTTENGQINDITVFDIVPLQGDAPEKIIKIETVTPSVKAVEEKEEKDKAKSEDDKKDGEKNKKADDDKDKDTGETGKSKNKVIKIDEEKNGNTDNITADESTMKGDDEEIDQVEAEDTDKNNNGHKKDTDNSKSKNKEKQKSKDNNNDTKDDDKEVDEDKKDRNWWRTWQWWRHKDKDKD
jgi:hypothetical protein